MNAERYLSRIGLKESSLPPTAQTLETLQRAHLYAVPYENLDILAGKPIALEREALYEKIVTRRRGGYCFELNELFGHLLRALGYNVTDSFGRFLRGETEIPMRRHHVLLVSCENGERFLCDVGVGNGSPTRPVPLIEGKALIDGRDTYRLRRDDFLGWVLEEAYKGGWRDVYSFTEERQLSVDFVATSFYCEKSPASPFNKAPMISLRTPEGRKTRDGDEFRIFDASGVRVITHETPEEADRLTREWFGLSD